jgi:hypothetical protein
MAVNLAIQQVGTGRSVEEYQAFGGYKDGKYTGDDHEDEVNIWIGEDESGDCYIGVAGRTFQGADARYFATAGFQRIARWQYEALRAVPAVFQKVKGD